jgi:hypothetical protein
MLGTYSFYNKELTNFEHVNTLRVNLERTPVCYGTTHESSHHLFLGQHSGVLATELLVGLFFFLLHLCFIMDVNIDCIARKLLEFLLLGTSCNSFSTSHHV